MTIGKLGKENTFTYLLSNDTFIIDYVDQIKKVSIANKSEIDGSVIGDIGHKINGKSPTALPINFGESITITPYAEAVVLDGIIITAPLGCELKILIQY